MASFIYSGPSIWPSLAKVGVVTVDSHENPTLTPLGWLAIGAVLYFLWRRFGK